MSDFSVDIKNFQEDGIYDYKFDNSGNLTFNSSSGNFNQIYLACPIRNNIYNKSKIESFYNPDFEEFIPQSNIITEQTSDVLNDNLNTLQVENENLKVQLDSLTLQNSNNDSVADQMATKQVILELRKMIGQGRVDSDFSDTFPYTSIIKSKI